MLKAMTDKNPNLSVRCDVTNPGHYFACCGLLELASRLQAEALGWFTANAFHIADGPTLSDLIQQFTEVELGQADASDATASPIIIPPPFNLRLDWWKAGDRGSSDLKVWAGTMESFRIARAMQTTMKKPEFSTVDLLNVGMVARDPDDPMKKVEPFYFDARRGPNAHSRDVGFAPNDLGMTTIASPAAELLCLIGLQRVRPSPLPRPKRSNPILFDYYTWSCPQPALLAPIAAAGLLSDAFALGYRFESWYRTGQRKHKAFLSAKLKPTTETP